MHLCFTLVLYWAPKVQISTQKPDFLTILELHTLQILKPCQHLGRNSKESKPGCSSGATALTKRNLQQNKTKSSIELSHNSCPSSWCKVTATCDSERSFVKFHEEARDRKGSVAWYHLPQCCLVSLNQHDILISGLLRADIQTKLFRLG